MGLNSGEKVIDGHRVCVTELPARPKMKCLWLAGKVLPALLKNLNGIVDSVKDIVGDDVDFGNMADMEIADIISEIDFSHLGNAIGDFFSLVTFEDFVDFSESVLQLTIIDGKNAGEMMGENYSGDNPFGEDITLLFKVVAYTVGVNRFFGKGVTGLPAILKKTN